MNKHERDEGPTPETRRLLSLHLDGELDAAAQADLDARIDACEATQAELAFWKRFRARLAEETAECEAPAPTRRVADAVMGTIGARNREVAAVLPFVRRLSVAAALLLLVAGGVLARLFAGSDGVPERLEIRPGLDLERSLVSRPGNAALFGGVSVEIVDPKPTKDPGGSGR